MSGLIGGAKEEVVDLLRRLSRIRIIDVDTTGIEGDVNADVLPSKPFSSSVVRKLMFS